MKSQEYFANREGKKNCNEKCRVKDVYTIEKYIIKIKELQSKLYKKIWRKEWNYNKGTDWRIITQYWIYYKVKKLKSKAQSGGYLFL